MVVGVGSNLRSDDAAGLRVAESLRDQGIPGLRVVLGWTAPENVTGEIRALRPSAVLFVDAADFGSPPGTLRLFDSAEAGGMSSSTHTLPLAIIARFLIEETGCTVHFLGLQPKTVSFGETLSLEAEAGVAEAVRAIRAALA